MAGLCRDCCYSSWGRYLNSYQRLAMVLCRISASGNGDSRGLTTTIQVRMNVSRAAVRILACTSTAAELRCNGGSHGKPAWRTTETAYSSSSRMLLGRFQCLPPREVRKYFVKPGQNWFEQPSGAGSLMNKDHTPHAVASDLSKTNGLDATYHGILDATDWSSCGLLPPQCHGSSHASVMIRILHLSIAFQQSP